MDQSHHIRTSAWDASACTRRLQHASVDEFPRLPGIADRPSPCVDAPRALGAAAYPVADNVTCPSPVGGISTDRLAPAHVHCSRPPSPSERSPLRAADRAKKQIKSNWSFTSVSYSSPTSVVSSHCCFSSCASRSRRLCNSRFARRSSLYFSSELSSSFS